VLLVNQHTPFQKLSLSWSLQLKLNFWTLHYFILHPILSYQTKKTGEAGIAKCRPKGQGGAAPLLLPPPPSSGSKVIVAPSRPPPPPGVSPVHNQNQSSRFTPAAGSSGPSQCNVDMLLDLGGSSAPSSAPSSSYSPLTTQTTGDSSTTDWDEFTGSVAKYLSSVSYYE